MINYKNIESNHWYKKDIEPHLVKYEVEYSSFEEGDLGFLDRVEFNCEQMGGGIDFWISGYISIHLVDYLKGEELMNIILEPGQYKEKEKSLEKLQAFLEQQGVST